MTLSASLRTCLRPAAVGLSLLLLGAGLAAGGSGFVQPIVPRDFDGVSGSNNSSFWSSAGITLAYVVKPPSALSAASVTVTSPSLLTASPVNWSLPGNTSSGATLDMEWALSIAGSAVAGTEFVVHYSVSGEGFANVTGSGYFVLPTAGTGPWSLALFVPLSAASPPPLVDGAVIDVFACASLGSCP